MVFSSKSSLKEMINRPELLIFRTQLRFRMYQKLEYTQEVSIQHHPAVHKLHTVYFATDLIWRSKGRERITYIKCLLWKPQTKRRVTPHRATAASLPGWSSVGIPPGPLMLTHRPSMQGFSLSLDGGVWLINGRERVVFFFLWNLALM